MDYVLPPLVSHCPLELINSSCCVLYHNIDVPICDILNALDTCMISCHMTVTWLLLWTDLAVWARGWQEILLNKNAERFSDKSS